MLGRLEVILNHTSAQEQQADKQNFVPFAFTLRELNFLYRANDSDLFTEGKERQ